MRDLTVVLGGRVILDKLSFTVPTGQTTAVIGPNGAGKSVLLKTMLGLIPHQTGAVEFFGIDQSAWKKIAPQISYVPQSLDFDRVFPLTVEGLFSLKAKGLLGMNDAARSRMQELLTVVGMAGSQHTQLATLSGGQRQRVLIAYSLFNKPRLLLLDEPVAGIDTTGQENVYELLERIQDEEDITLLMVSHELDIVMRYASQVLCLNQQLLCAGVPREVLSNELLASMYGSSVGHFHHTHDKHA